MQYNELMLNINLGKVYILTRHFGYSIAFTRDVLLNDDRTF